MTLDDKIKIAIFMGYEYTTEEFKDKWLGNSIHNKGRRPSDESMVPILISNETDVLFTDTITYDSNWESMMEVVEKVESMNYNFVSWRCFDCATKKVNNEWDCMIIDGEDLLDLNFPVCKGNSINSKIESFFDAIVEFIDLKGK